MQLRILALQGRQQIRVVAKRQLSVQTADDVQFRSTFGDCLTGNPEGLVDVVRVGVWLPWRAVKAAKLAIRITDIRMIEMSVDVEVSSQSMFLTPYLVCQLSQSQEVIRRVQREAISEREPFPSLNLASYFYQFGIV
jgi:hypothetical protein